MRLRSLTAISFVAIALSLGALAAVPGLRDAVAYSLAPEPTYIDYLFEAEQRPDDPDAWLAALWDERPSRASPEQRERAYEQAAALLPHSAAPHVLYGIRGVALRRAEVDAWAGDKAPDYEPTVERPLTPSERENLAKAWKRLERAAELDPQNAAIDYLRAYLALAGRQDQLAMRILREALGKSHWNMYESDGTAAAYRVARKRLRPLDAATAATSVVDTSAFPLEGLAKTLVGMANLAGRRGDHAQAVFLRQAAMHLGQLILRHSYSIFGGLMGHVVWASASEQEPSDAQLEELGSPNAQTEGANASERGRWETSLARRKAARRNLAEYLRGHGRDDLADELLAFGEATDESLGLVIAHNQREFERHSRSTALGFGLGQSTDAMVGTLGVLVACSIAGLLLGLLGRPVLPIRWPAAGWLALIAACLAAACAAGLMAPHCCEPIAGTASHHGHLHWAGRALPALGGWFVFVGLPLILLCVLAVVVLQRRRGEGRAVGLVGNYVGTLIAVLLPLAAFLCLTTIGLATTTAREVRSRTAANEAIIEQGEMAYYELAIE